ncbi:MAG: hypothetical protein LYZ70_00585 [Nitrososphaerales archaeon]|nr:hypothetical protein [Nitrososphaerales archaeon]
MSKMSHEMVDVHRPYAWTDNRLVAGLVAAFGATFFATMFGEWFYAIGWVPFSFNTLNAEVWATNFHNLSGFFAVTAKTALSPDFTYFLGMWAHYSQGIIFGLVFTLLVYSNLPGPMTVGANLVKGLLWGWTLWIVSNSFVMPLMYGTGFWFSYWGSAFGLGQTNLIFYNFVWHSIYGFVLGMFFSPVSKMTEGMGETGQAKMSMGPMAHWGQVVLGWIIIIIGGWISSLGFTTNAQGSALTNAWLGAGQASSPWGVVVGLIGLIVATAPAFNKWRMKR